MIGVVTEKGTPTITLSIDGQGWLTVIDTGFDGDFELPQALFASCVVEHIGPTLNQLAGGIMVVEELYAVQLPFDGGMVSAEATFVDGNEVLLGTGLLRDYRMTIDFPAGTVQLERT